MNKKRFRILAYVVFSILFVGCLGNQYDQIPEDEETIAGSPTTPASLPPTAIPSPTPGIEVQLTYVTYNPNISKVWGMAIYCFEESEDCFGEPQMLFEYPGFIASADWSSDGQRVVFDNTNGDRDAVVVADWNGENAIEVISDEETKFYNPLWSPDNDELVYSTINQYESSQIYLVDTNTMASKELIIDPALDLLIMDWSPDGKKFLYSGYDSEGTSQIYISDVDGSHLVNLTNSSKLENNYSSYFSPNGDLISFGRENYDKVKVTSKSFDLYTITVEGNYERNITNNPDGIYTLNQGWYPDGKWLLIITGQTNNMSIFLLSLEDMKRIEVPLDAEADFLSWRVIR